MMGINGITDEWLHQKYAVEGRSTREVARLLECSVNGVKRRLRNLEILRSQSESALLRHRRKRGITLLDNQDEVKRLYVEEGLPIRAISKIIGVGGPAVRRCLRQQGVYIESFIETMQSFRNARWKGGVSKVTKRSPGFTRELKRRIRDRDENQCVICGFGEGSARLAVHHRDFDKNNHLEENLVTLCYSVSWLGPCTSLCGHYFIKGQRHEIRLLL